MFRHWMLDEWTLIMDVPLGDLRCILLLHPAPTCTGALSYGNYVAYNSMMDKIEWVSLVVVWVTNAMQSELG